MNIKETKDGKPGKIVMRITASDPKSVVSVFLVIIGALLTLGGPISYLFCQCHDGVTLFILGVPMSVCGIVGLTILDSNWYIMRRLRKQGYTVKYFENSKDDVEEQYG